jgi:preprotein translocase subunit SecD
MRSATADQGGRFLRGKRAGAPGMVLAALVFTIAGCSQALPLGPTPAPAPVQRQLATPIVLQIVRSQPASLSGSCPAGSAKLPDPANQFAGSAQCYSKVGTPLTITSAAVNLYQAASGQQPANYGVSVILPAARAAALAAITTQAYQSRDQIATIVVGQTWGAANVLAPFAGGQFEIPAQSTNQARHLLHTLDPSAAS